MISMNDKHIRKRILEAAEHDTPDLRSVLLPAVEARVSTSRNHGWSFKKPIGLGLVFASLFLLLIVYNPFQSAPALTSVYLEFNPSIVIHLDETDHFSTLEGLNSDGIEFVQTLTPLLQSQHIDDVLDIIIEEALALGYLSSDNPVILYDVIHADIDVASRVLAALEQTLPTVAQRHVTNAAIRRGMAGDSTDHEQAMQNQHNVSVMKLRLIQSILDTEEGYTFEALLELSIKELLELSDQMPHRNMPNRPLPR